MNLVMDVWDQKSEGGKTKKQQFHRFNMSCVPMVRKRTMVSRNSKVKRYFMVIDPSHLFFVPWMRLTLSEGCDAFFENRDSFSSKAF
jgi:hypothetical protein